MERTASDIFSGIAALQFDCFAGRQPQDYYATADAARSPAAITIRCFHQRYSHLPRIVTLNNSPWRPARMLVTLDATAKTFAISMNPRSGATQARATSKK